MDKKLNANDAKTLYQSYVRYVDEAFREHKRIGSRLNEFELRTGTARSQDDFRLLLSQLESNQATKSRFVSRIERGFLAEGSELRTRLEAAIGTRPLKKAA